MVVASIDVTLAWQNNLHCPKQGNHEIFNSRIKREEESHDQ